MMTDMEIESLDYKLSRLKPGKSTCIKPGEWAYLASDGSLHRLINEGYYSGYGGDMWISSHWFVRKANTRYNTTSQPKGVWTLGASHSSKKRLIKMIEQWGPWCPWEWGFGKGGEATDQQERLA